MAKDMQMNTRIGVDGTSAEQSLASLRREIKATTAEWKANESVQRANGDYQAAYKAKVDGTAKSIELQKGYIETLKSNMSLLNRETSEGADKYTKLSTQLSNAERQLSNMSQQQERAKSTLDLYKSGILQQKNAMETAQKASEALVNRYKAEGKELEANKERLSGVKNQISSLTSLYEKEEAQLKKVASESGTTSSEYQKQSVRVNDLGTKLATARNEETKLNASMKNTPSGVFSRLINHSKQLSTNLSETREKSNKLGSSLKNIFLGNVLANGVSRLGSSLVDSAKDGLKLAEAGEQTKRSWSGMGLAKDEISGMSKEMVELRAQSGFTGGAIIDVQKRIYGFTGSFAQTQNLTRAFTALSVESNKGEEGVSALSNSFGKVESAGKLTTMAFTRMTKAVPSLPIELAKALNMSQDQLKQAVSNGDISADKFNKAMTSVAANSDKTFKNFGKTGEGIVAQIKGSWTSLKSTTMQPLIDTKASGLGTLRDALQSPAMQKAAKDLGEAIKNIAIQASKVVEYIADHSKDIQGIIGDLGTIVGIMGKTAWSVFSGILTDIGKAFGLISTNGSKAKSPLDSLKSLADNLAKNQKGVQTATKALIAFFAAKSIISGASTITGLAKSFGLLSGSMIPITLPAVAIVGAITALGAALVYAYKTSPKFRKALSDMGKAFKDLWKVAQPVLKPLFNILKDIFKALWDTFVGTIVQIVKWDTTIVKTFTSVIKFFSNFSKNWNNITKDIGTFWNNTWSSIGKFFQNVWNTISKTGHNGISNLSNWISNGLASISDGWHNMWNGMASFFKGIWNGIKKSAAGGINGVIGVINAGINGIDSLWKAFGQSAPLSKIATVKFANGGWVGGQHGGQLSMLNDGGGAHWKELAITPSGNAFIPKGRNAVVMLPNGTRVFNGEETHNIMSGLGIKHYKDGGIVGSLEDGAESVIDFTKGVTSWMGDKIEGIMKFLANPIENTKGLLKKATSGLYPNVKMFGDLAHGTIDKMGAPLGKWLKDKLEPAFEKLVGSMGGGGARPASAYGPLIRAAAAYMHQSINDFNVDMIERIIGNESGGNPRAINLWDSNAKAGHPSKGILQYIDGTFRNYAMPGHTDIWNPLDQLIALFNDATWRSDMGMGYNGKYGEWRGAASGPSGPRLMANGGIVHQATNAIVGEAGTEAVIPLNNKMRAFELMHKAIDYMNGGQSTPNTENQNGELTDTMKSQLMATQEQNSLLKNILSAIGSSNGNGGSGMDNFLQQMAGSKRMHDFQAGY